MRRRFSPGSRRILRTPNSCPWACHVPPRCSSSLRLSPTRPKDDERNTTFKHQLRDSSRKFRCQLVRFWLVRPSVVFFLTKHKILCIFPLSFRFSPIILWL